MTQRHLLPCHPEATLFVAEGSVYLESAMRGYFASLQMTGQIHVTNLRTRCWWGSLNRGQKLESALADRQGFVISVQPEDGPCMGLPEIGAAFRLNLAQ